MLSENLTNLSSTRKHAVFSDEYCTGAERCLFSWLFLGLTNTTRTDFIDHALILHINKSMAG